MFDLVNIAFAAVKSAPTEVIGGLALEGSSTPSDLSLWGLFWQAGAVVKFVMISLMLSSIWSWAIIFDKWLLIKSINSKVKSFEKSFWSGQSLETLYERIKGRDSHPMAIVFSSAMHEWQMRSMRDLQESSSLRAGTKERIYQAMQVSINKSLDALDKNLNFLATVGSSAPFVGLFGTVWGIMVSFQSIAISKNTTLAVVAPGIAEALLATAFGLAAAIPAVIFYNKFANETNRISSKLEDFSAELGAIMSRELDNIK
ncbi:MAG: protein TolQ [Candidatus Jidaibacter sp.]|jgi:biopolymer transport protein TolQ|nr:protein TolQ [Candidatus Jidaibacter sp.]